MYAIHTLKNKMLCILLQGSFQNSLMWYVSDIIISDNDINTTHFNYKQIDTIDFYYDLRYYI